MTTSADAYLASLPEVETARLPRGTLFVANSKIYQVTEVGTGGFAKARQWRQNESTDVALIPNSFLTKYMPLVKMGRLLPVYRTRTELTEDGTTRCFVFPTEALALDAAYLDVALIMSAGAYVRNHNHEPAFAVTDGVHNFRLYFYLRSVHNRATIIKSNTADQTRGELHSYMQGPSYWQLLSSWQESFPPSKATQLSMPKVASSPVMPPAMPPTLPPATSLPPTLPPGTMPPAGSTDATLVTRPASRTRLEPLVPRPPLTNPPDNGDVDHTDLDKTRPNPKVS